jgi:membrane associated rhomboid family serine protease
MIPIQDTVPRRSPPVITYLIIIVNTLVFSFQLILPDKSLEAFFYLFGLVPARFSHPDWAISLGIPVDTYWPFLTNMFLHGGWFHIIINMWTLWIFGDNVEDRMGSIRFIFFYILCGVAASVGHYFTNLSSTVPALGASGAIAGVMGAYMLMFPRARILTMIPILFFPFFFEIPAFFYLLVWFYSQFFNGTFALLSPQSGGGIAWWAHIGGFVAGLILCKLFLRTCGERRKLQKDELYWKGAWHGKYR